MSTTTPFLDEELFFGRPEEKPGFRALALESPFRGALEYGQGETGVVDRDDRVRVSPTVGVPWRWICRIDVMGHRQAHPGGGTGVLISNRHVLTAAHVVYEAARNMQNFSIQVIPALDYGDEPFGSYLVTAKPRLPRHYRPGAANHLDFDYALLTLDTPVGERTFKKLNGDALCYWGSPQCGANSVFARPDPAQLNGKAALTAGYPKSSGAKKLMSAAGMLHSAGRLRRTMGITADTTHGQSGSPIWIEQNGSACLVGLAVGAGQRTNTAVRVTRELVRQLRAWIAEDGETPSMIENEEAQGEFDAADLAAGELERHDERLQEQWVGPAGGGVAPWAAGIEPFPPEPTLVFHVNDDRMTQAFAPVTVSTASQLCAAVVDLTGGPAMPPYAGLNDEEMVFAGSLPKICAMYAAFGLRAQVQAFVDAAKANGATLVLPGIAREIDKAWRPKLRALFPARPTKSFGNAQDIGFPKLEQMFTFSADGKVDFARAVPALTNADLDARIGRVSPEFKTPPGKFHDWMRLMLRWSNNTAASKCILALGYFYLNGALARAGLFDADSSNGLWLSADFRGHDWVSAAAEQRSNAAGPRLTPRWAAAQRRQRSNITATAAQVARFMTLLAQGKLVDATASGDMLALMNITPSGIGSYAKRGLDLAGRASTAFASKIGFGDDSFSHDCALIERSVAGKHLRYVAVGLGSAPTRKRQDLRDLFVLLDETIVARNA